MVEPGDCLPFQSSSPCFLTLLPLRGCAHASFAIMKDSPQKTQAAILISSSLRRICRLLSLLFIRLNEFVSSAALSASPAPAFLSKALRRKLDLAHFKSILLPA